MIADLVELAWRQPRIGDDCPGVDPARRQKQRSQRDAVFTDDDHPVARPDAERSEIGGNLGDVPIQFAIQEAPSSTSATWSGVSATQRAVTSWMRRGSPAAISSMSIACDQSTTANLPDHRAAFTRRHGQAFNVLF